ncbi:hypothetical protein NFI08_16375 [Halomonas sp. EF61]|uniref:hypothetical protein n=1 Tax=Halomonas sp. EF61 TaxID=2950869 RepID=UPI0032DE59F2
MSDKLRAMLANLPSVEPPTEEEEREARLIFQQEPSVVTLCRTCEQIGFGMRLGCANSDCPDQPWAVNISYMYDNHQGQLLRPGRDWMPFGARPLTEWT